MAKTDANPPMPEFRDDYVLQEVDADVARPRRSSPSSSSTSTSPSASCARAASTSARGSASTWSPPTRSTRPIGVDQPGVDPSDHVIFIIDDDVCTRCALCVDRCPTGVIIMGKVGDPDAGRRRPPAHQHPRLRLRHAARVGEAPWQTTMDGKSTGERIADSLKKLPDTVQGTQAWNSIFRPGLDLPEGLHRQPPEPVLRDHELGAVPPAPGEGEAPRGEGELHALPRRAELLPLHPAHGHRHLPDVLLPADRGAGVGRHLHAADVGHLRPARAEHAPMGART